ncbi:MAG: DUF3405 domain-containing protein [Lunatimonas sp.]|uniref:DUF3405 domain-containing protein n=1 Tax=Lunatimonas sp. TaxID=2060141 RepID=UPI00263B45F9|nr:DUF3405 domain-containing protein [Lunatimonas sp.]MCC5935940.1 DUF3405 domain-containing protein [Lunatimonas sp.]
MESSKEAFLILSNNTSIHLIRKYREIFEATSGLGDTLLLYHLLPNNASTSQQKLEIFAFNNEVLTALNYFPLGFTLVPGSNHFPLLKFYLSHPNYDYYWCIEEDVDFSGDWRAFFDAFSSVDADFISSHIRRYQDEPEWPWWSALAHPYFVIPQKQRIRSFNPIYRISRAGLELLHKVLSSKWCGHHEVLIPTLLYESGLSISDFGGMGEFVPDGFENRFYLENTPNPKGILSDGTMRWRPVFEKTGSLENKLYHPVKLKDE